MRRAFLRFAAIAVTRPNMTVLEVGSQDVNGNPRQIFEQLHCRYTGVDIEAGRNVDVVYAPGEPLPFADASFDLCVSSSTFEHDPAFWVTIREMARVTKMGGLVYATAPSTGPYHAHPGDNWRFYRDAPAALAMWTGRVVDGKQYPLKVRNQTFISDDKLMHSNSMLWERTGEATIGKERGFEVVTTEEVWVQECKNGRYCPTLRCVECEEEVTATCINNLDQGHGVGCRCHKKTERKLGEWLRTRFPDAIITPVPRARQNPLRLSSGVPGRLRGACRAGRPSALLE